MREMADLKRRWQKLPRALWATAVIICLLLAGIAATGFLEFTPTPKTPIEKLTWKIQQLDATLLLAPIANHWWIALAVAVLCLFLSALYGEIRDAYRSQRLRFLSWAGAPLSFTLLGAVIFVWARRRGLTNDAVVEAPFRFWSWLLLSTVVAILGSNVFTWVGCLTHGPKTLPEMLEQRHIVDLEDLGGAATWNDLRTDSTPLLIRFQNCAWPNLENAEVQRLIKGRLVIGRYYERKTPTNLWVCPEILKMQQTLVVAPPGAGKTFAICLPWGRELPEQGHSVFMVDVKGNMAKRLLSQGNRVRQRIHVFDPSNPDRSIRWNIFEEIERLDPDALRLGTKLITQAIFGEISRGESQFWDRTEQGFIAAGLELLIRSNPTASPPDLARLFRSREALTAQIAQLKALMSAHAENYTAKDLDRVEYIESRLQLLLEDDRQKKFGFNELSQGVKIKLEPFENGHVERVTTKGTFRLAQLAALPSCMVFAAPLNMGEDAASLAAIAFRLLQLLMHGRYSSETHAHRIFFILDEFSKLRASTHESEVFLSTSREAGCVSVVILQEVSQLDERSRDALLGDLRDCYILHGAARRTAEWFEAAFGKRRHIRASFTEQNSASANRTSDGVSLSATEEWVPVLAAREIRKTGGLQYGAWVSYKNYADQKPILVDMERPETLNH